MTFAQCVMMIAKMAVSSHPGRATLRRTAYLQRMSRIVCQQSMRRRLDPVLVLSVIRVESGFQSWLVSSTSDWGLMQINSKTRIGTAQYPGRRKCDLLKMRCNIDWGTYIMALWRRKCKGKHHWLRHYNWYGASGKYYLNVLWIRAAYKAAWDGRIEAYSAIRSRAFPKNVGACLRRRDLCI